MYWALGACAAGAVAWCVWAPRDVPHEYAQVAVSPTEAELSLGDGGEGGLGLGEVELGELRDEGEGDIDIELYEL